MTNNAGAANDDPDGDGINNLMEYAMGSDPNAPSTLNLPTMGLNGDACSISYPVNTAVNDVNYYLETSIDLSNWMRVDAVPTQLSSGIQTRIYQDYKTDSHKFYRLSVEQK